MTSAVLAFLVAAVVSIIIGPWMIRLATRLKLRQTVSEDAPARHAQKQGTPTMGGLIILVGAIAGAIAFWNTDARATAVALMTLAFAGLGFLDDYLIVIRGKNLGLKARQKLALQIVIATAFVAWIVAKRTALPTVLPVTASGMMELGWLYYPFAILLVVGMSNAVNLTDGLDGLASGLMVIVGLALAGIVMVAREAHPGLSVISCALAGGCAGFLWYNCNPARIFMGDTGSLALGAAIAGIGIAGRREILLLGVSLVFIVEALSVIVQVISFKSTGKRVFKMTPIHHHFELSGWPEQKIVVRFWIVQGLIVLAVLAGAGVLRLWD